MRVRKLLAITLTMILVLGTFTFGYSTENLNETDVEEPQALQKVEEEGPAEEEPEGQEEWIPEAKDPDNLGGPVKIDSPKLFKPQAETKMRSLDSGSKVSLKAGYPPGHIFLDKTATPVKGECNLWGISLTLEGIDGEQTSDTVLVIDRSGSMDDGTKFTDAKNAAKSFVDLVLDGTNDSNHRIAVVSFSSSIGNVIGFSSDPGSIKTAIGNIADPTGGTHTQAALRQAEILINNSTADSQNIILLSDGDPTYGYDMANNPKYDLRYPDVDQTIDSSRITGFFSRTYYRDVYTGYENPTDSSSGDFDYNETRGSGNSLREKVGDFVNGSQTGSGSLNDRYVQNYDRLYYNAGNAAISEADMIKNNGRTIYTISLDAGTEGTIILKDIATSGNDYTGSSNDLQSIYQQIAGSINYAATNAVVTDPLGPYFDIPGINASNYNSLITVSSGTTINWNDTTETIEWDIGNISAANPVTMTYQVAMDPSGFGQGQKPTNGDTFVAYDDIEGDPATKDFDVPEVAATCRFGELTIIKRVFIDEVEIPNDDTVFEFEVNGQTVTASAVSSGSIFLPIGTYSVEEVNYGDWVPDDLSQDVILTTDGATVTFINRYTTPTGDLTIEKEVYIDGELDVDNDEVFEFEVNGEVVTASAINSGTITLPVGTHIVEETEYGDFTPDFTTTGVAITPNGGRVTFTNRYDTPNGDVTVYKEIDGEQSGRDFNFRIYEGTGTGGAVEAQTSVDINNPEFIDGLEPGTYTIAEQPVEGYIIPEPYTFYLEPGESKDITLTNIEVLPEPSMRIEKVADDYSLYVGENVIYTITVTNTGEGDLENVLVTDAQLGYSNTVTIPEGGTFVDTITTSYGSTGTKVNTARAEYGIETDNYIMVEDSVEVEVRTRPVSNPGFDIEKTVDKTSLEIGEDVTYTITVTNTGNVTLANVFIEDADLGYTTTETLSAGEVFTHQITTSYPAAGTYVNTATANHDSLGEISDTATVVVNEEETPPEMSMTIDKDADDYSVETDEDVTYTITVTNTGEVDLVDVLVTDAQLGYSNTVTIAAGESFIDNITTSYDNEGSYVNTASAEYGTDTNDYMMVEDSVEVEVEDDNGGGRPNARYRMTIDKEAQEDEVEVGDMIRFTVTVENTGNRTLNDIEVVDDMTGLNETITLEEGESQTFNVSVRAEEVGILTNTAEANHDRAPDVEDSDSVEVVGEEIDDEDIPEDVPGTYEIAIEKTAVGSGPVYSGDMIEFTIVVTNTGDEILTNIMVEDDMVDFEAVVDELAPGQSEEFTVMVEAPNIPGPFTNTATATSSETGTLEAEDTVFVEEPVPLDVPDTGVAPIELFFGLGALASGLGLVITKKRRR